MGKTFPVVPPSRRVRAHNSRHCECVYLPPVLLIVLHALSHPVFKTGLYGGCSFHPDLVQEKSGAVMTAGRDTMERSVLYPGDVRRTLSVTVNRVLLFRDCSFISSPFLSDIKGNSQSTQT